MKENSNYGDNGFVNTHITALLEKCKYKWYIYIKNQKN